MAPANVIYYDSVQRRLWIAGQRCHHGATGAILTGAAAAAAAVGAGLKAPRLLAMVSAGTLLMAHDWHDRTMWFERGWGTQP